MNQRQRFERAAKYEPALTISPLAQRPHRGELFRKGKLVDIKRRTAAWRAR